MISGFIATNVLYQGQVLLSYKILIASVVSLFVLVIIGPLVMFTPLLAREKRNGLVEYGNLASDYVRKFDDKWLHDGAKGEEVLGTGDIQSLADLGNSYVVLGEMRLVPFGIKDIVRLAVATAAPMAPLLLIIMPMEEVVTRIFKIIF